MSLTLPRDKQDKSAFQSAYYLSFWPAYQASFLIVDISNVQSIKVVNYIRLEFEKIKKNFFLSKSGEKNIIFFVKASLRQIRHA